MPRGTKAPKLWPAEPVKLTRIVSSGRPVAAVALGDLVAEHRADGAVDVADRQLDLAPAAPCSSAGGGVLDELRCRARRSRPWSCVPGAVAGPARSGVSGWWRIGVRSRPLAFQWSTASRGVEHLDVADRLGRATGSPSAARSSRTSSAMYSKKVTTNSGLPVNRWPQLRVLRGDADRAGVEVADAHHDAAATRRAARWRSRTPRRRAARRSRRRGRSSSGRRSARRCGRAGR